MTNFRTLEEVMDDALCELHRHLQRTTTRKVCVIPDDKLFGEVLETYRKAEPGDTETDLDDVRRCYGKMLERYMSFRGRRYR